jgi:hypothetical protein
MVDALFVPDNGGFIATEWSRGGWDDNLLHGGPPAGLMAWAIERHPTPAPMHMARATFDLFRAIPLGRLEVSVETIRAGRRIQIDRAMLTDGTQEVAMATALRIRLADINLGDVVRPPWQGPEPAEAHPTLEWMHSRDETVRFHTTTVETRSVGRSMEQLGPGTAWHRLTVPVVAGHETSPTVQAAALSDMLNGVSRTLRTRDWIYVNPDVTMYLHRAPGPGWIGIRGESHPHLTGIGVNHGTMFDAQGPIGAVAMSQLIEPIATPAPGFPDEN